jgi:hypothetical protein
LVVHAGVVETIVGAVLAARERGEPLGPSATTLLVRTYSETGRSDVADALGAALADALDHATDRDEVPRRAAWLVALVEAAAVSDDERLSRVSGALAADLEREWPAAVDVDHAMRAVEACLAYGMAAPAIDELERVIGATYTPGSGVAHSPSDPRGDPGTLADHVSAASALIAAYSLSGRLPYSMLAEELVRFTLRTWPNPNRSPHQNAEPCSRNLELFVLRSELSRVLCRLARLHQDAAYRQAAVLADCDYAAEVERMLAALADDYAKYGAAAAVYALAIIESAPVR